MTENRNWPIIKYDWEKDQNGIFFSVKWLNMYETWTMMILISQNVNIINYNLAEDCES